jgi:hypothetical protein
MRAGFPLALALAASGVGVLTAGCQATNEPIYIAAPAPLDVSGTDMGGAPNRIKGAVVLRFRQPTAAERRTLDEDSRTLTFDVPWLKRDRIHIEVLYTVKNNDTKDGTFRVSVDGANEFTKYDEDAIAQAFADANEKTQPLALMAPTPRTLGAGQIYQGILREDDLVEGELDLDAMGRWMAPFAAVLINRSDVNPVGLEMVPAKVVIPAMQELDLVFSAEQQMHCEFMVRVRSDDDQLLHESGDKNLFVPTPVVFTPAIPPP